MPADKYLIDAETADAETGAEVPPQRRAGGLRWSETLRWLWTQLTSMRTALVLLFALALGAIPGSLLPQRPTSPVRVSEFIANNPQLGGFYDAIGLFDVYASPWFAAIYLLLFVSLVGCIIPRIAVYLRGLRAEPPRTPRNLGRLPAHLAFAAAGDDALDRAERVLRGRRFRVRRFDDSVSAERGYLRELGNLVFHVSLVFLLCGVAWGALFGYKGTVAVVEGQSFSNTLTQFDDFTAGGMFRASQLVPFTVKLDSFEAKFETGPVQRGAARLFRANTTTTLNGVSTDQTLEVNHPLVLGGSTVHLVGHGYAVDVTVKDAQGRVAFEGPVILLPQDGNFQSVGVVKAPFARPERLAFEALFLPTAVDTDNGGASAFPDALNPLLLLNAWHGLPKEATGVPENVYSLDTTGLTQFTVDGKPLRFTLEPGQSYKLPDGSTIQFNDWKRWVSLQVSSTPGLWLVFGSVLVAVAGLCLSLFVRPRRVWVKVTEQGVEVAGLDRTEGRGGLHDEITLIADGLGLAQVPPDGAGSPQSDEEN
ncbi:cytochrome c biogenesis protein ResB [Micropruina sp.]|uniref:cytochrome c biogenesis protein ResB n=1 Tax=Micropruina sp. TaxID=2737536 RepID=UPI0039E391BB